MKLGSLLRLARKKNNFSCPIRVCFVIDRLSRAGTETQLLALIRSLDRSRILPHLVMLNGDDEESRMLEPQDCPVYRLGLRRLVGLSAPGAAYRLRRFWRQYGIDIVQTYFLDSTYFGIPLARLCGIAQVLRVRNNSGYWLNRFHSRLGRGVGSLADYTLTNSEAARQALLEAEGLPIEKVAVLENGVDLERFPKPAPPETSRADARIGIVANLRPVKNIDGFIRTAGRICQAYPRLRFEVAGDGDERPRLERLIDACGLSRNVQLLGQVQDVPEFLARQDIGVLCSHSEGMSNALLEYMAAGRAIVATDVGANGRLIENGIHGRIVAANDDAALAAGIEAHLQHPRCAAAMALAARRRVEAEYSRAAMVRRFEDFYEQIVSIDR